MIYRFDAFSLDTGSLELRRDDVVVPVEPQVFSILAYLIENRDRVVGKDELIDAVWDGRAISDGALNSRINSVRRAVGDDGSAQSVIKTFTRRGFRFVGAVSEDIAPDSEAGNSLAAQSDKPSIAVLPFDNLSNDPEQEYFSDGITEDLITALSRIRWLLVIARNTTFLFKARAVDIKQVASELGVRFVLEGSVRKSGNRIRINVQLIDGATGNQVWAQRYDRDIEDIFDLQDELTETIIAAIEPAMQQAEQERVKRKPAENFDAWEAYQRGTWFLNTRLDENVPKARELFERSIELDPGFVPAYCGLSFSYSWGSYLSFTDPDLDAAFAAARKAVALDQHDPDAHTALGFTYYITMDHDLAISELEMAIGLNPSLAYAYFQLAGALGMSGRAEEAIPHAQTAIRLSPNDSSIGPFTARFAQAYLFLARHEEAVEWARKALRYPNISWPVHIFLVAALGHLGREDEARRAVDNLLRFQAGMNIGLARERLPITDAGYLDHLLEGLRKAGLPE